MFHISEIVEKVFENLETKDLLKIRSVSSLWNDEAIKQLMKRGYGKKLKIGKRNDCSPMDFSKIDNLLAESKHPKILFQALEFHINPSLPISSPEFQRPFKNFGYLIKNLTFSKSSREPAFDLDKVLALLPLFQNIETLKICPFTSKCKASLEQSQIFSPFENLTSLEITCNSGRRPTHPCFIDIFKEIVKSTECLENLEINSSYFPEFFDPQDLKVKTKLKSLKCLKLGFFETGSTHQDISNQEKVIKLLSMVSCSLETLEIYSIKNFPISRLPQMPCLRTLVIDDGHNCPTGIKDFSISKNTRELDTLLLGDVHGWSNKWPMENAKWMTKVVSDQRWSRRGVRTVCVGAATMKQDPSQFKYIQKPLNIGLCFVWDATEMKSWFDDIIKELAKSNVKLMCLFFARSGTALKEYVLEKCLAEIPNLNRCVICCENVEHPNTHEIEVVIRQPA